MRGPVTSLPRVTAILEAVGLGPDFSAVPPAILEAARARGAAVHALAEALGYGYLDDGDIRPELAPYVDALRKFYAESGAQHIASEFEVRSPSWRYVGHPDLLVWLNGVRVLIDIKTGDATGAEYQVAAYVQAHNEEHPTTRVTAAAVLHLRDDRTYRLAEVELPAATQVWIGAVVVYQAQRRRA